MMDMEFYHSIRDKNVEVDEEIVKKIRQGVGTPDDPEEIRWEKHQTEHEELMKTVFGVVMGVRFPLLFNSN